MGARPTTDQIQNMRTELRAAPTGTKGPNAFPSCARDYRDGVGQAGTRPVMMYPVPSASSRTWTSSTSGSS
jgi:hypothetical protein